MLSLAADTHPEPGATIKEMDRHSAPRIAFFGGSFDPPHCGHLAIATAAADALQLDSVLFAPVGLQPLKSGGSGANFPHRVEMVRLAVAADPRFAVCLADAPRPDGIPNYTLDTLRHLSAEMPSEAQLFCLIGADSLATLAAWHRADEIPFAAHLIVVSRPGEPLDDIEPLLPRGLSLLSPSPQHLPGAGSVDLRCCVVRNQSGATAPLYIVAGLEIPISATEVRTQLRRGAATDMIPFAVANYICEHRLYR